AVAGENAVGQAGKLAFKVFVAHWMTQAADGVLDELFNAAAAFGCNRNSYLVLVQRRINDGRNAVAQRRHRPVADRSITELVESAPAFHERDAGGVIDTDFSFQSGLRRLLAGELHDERMNLEFNMLDLVWRQLALVSSL